MNFACQSRAVDLRHTDGFEFHQLQVSKPHGHQSMNVHSGPFLIHVQVKAALQGETGKGQLAHGMGQDVCLTTISGVGRIGHDQMVLILILAGIENRF